MAGTSKTNKNKRSVIDLETKHKIILQFESGKKVKDIAYDLKLSHSTISTILKDKKRILEAVKESTSMKSTIITKNRQGPIHDMEKLLVIWMEDLIQKRIPLSLAIIQTKACSLFNMLKLKEGENYDQTFTASHGWFQRFRKRANFQNVNISGEAASADYIAAEEFVVKFNEFLKENNYTKEQIFNVDETGLYWKKMPERTYIHKEEKSMPGFKAFKDRVTVLLGGNIAGYKLKPFVVHRSKNPRAFKGVNINMLPVHYNSNKNAWMTQLLFEDWFMKVFATEVKEYCNQHKIPFKILLLLDNAPGHPPHLGDLHPNIQIMYLPPNTTSILQPMDQGAIATFKAHYLKITFTQAIMAIEEGITLKEFWSKYNILQGIKNLASGWKEVKASCMSGIWKKLTKIFEESTSSSIEKEVDIEEITDQIVDLGRQLNLEVVSEDINQLIAHQLDDLTNEDLLEFEAQCVGENEDKSKTDEEESPQKKFSTKEMSAAFHQINTGMLKLQQMDANEERFSEVNKLIQKNLACYYEIYREMKPQTVQTTLDRFVKKTSTGYSVSEDNAMDCSLVISTDDEDM
jgi:hypothetical protein